MPITLVYGQRTRDELYYDAEFRALAAAHPHFSYVPALSNEPKAATGPARAASCTRPPRRTSTTTFPGHKAYLCGPPPMIDACITTLMQGRLFERDIYTEKFLSAADAAQARSPLFKRI